MLIQNQDKIPILFYTTVRFSTKTEFPELRHDQMSVQSSLHTRKLMATVTSILSQYTGQRFSYGYSHLTFSQLLMPQPTL